MRAYGKLESGFWQNRKTRNLTDLAKLLLIYLYSCPHGNSVGCFVLPEGYIATDLQWTVERVSEHVSELVSKGLANYDREANLLRIVGWFGHNTIENGNVAIGAMKTVRSLPNCPVKSLLISELMNLDNKFIAKYRNEFSNMVGRCSETQNQNQNQNQNRIAAPSRVPAHAPMPAAKPGRAPAHEGNSLGKYAAGVVHRHDPLAAQHDLHPRFEEVRAHIVGRLPHLKDRRAQEVSEWLHAGADPAKDIYPAVELLIGQRGHDIGSFKFFSLQVTAAVRARRENEEQHQRLARKYAQSE